MSDTSMPSVNGSGLRPGTREAMAGDGGEAAGRAAAMSAAGR